MHRVFVYGTLKRGEANHHWLAGGRFGGRRRLRGVRLHDLGPYPMAVPAEDAALIHGELYAVDPAGLAALDRLEDVPVEYERHCLLLTDDTEAWVYLGRPEQVRGRPVVPYGDWGATPVFNGGSSLCPELLGRHCPAWDGSGLVARLDGWRFTISGIRPDPGAHCWGVVHHLAPADRRALERLDGVAPGQGHRHDVRVSTPAGECFPALVQATGGGDPRRILSGARHWGLPPAWREQLAATLRRRSTAAG